MSSYESPPSWCGDKWINALWPTDATWWHRPGQLHDDVIKWKHFPRYWPSVRGIHRSPVNSPHKGQWRGALIFSLISVWINGWVNNREAGDLRRYHAHYDVGVMVAQAMAWWTKPLPQPLLANYQRWLVLTREQLHRKYSRYRSLVWIWKLLI